MAVAGARAVAVAGARAVAVEWTKAGVWAVAAIAAAAGPVAACGGDRGSDASVDSPAAAEDAASAADAVDSEADSGSDDDSVTDDPDNAPLDPLSIRGDVIKEDALVIGDCFNRLHDLRAGRKVVITARVGCDQPHVYEVFHVFDVEAPHPAVHPGDIEMDAYARRRCYDHFEAFVGEIYERSVYEIGVFTPDRTSFEHDVARYRTVHCWLRRTDDEPTTFSARGAVL